MVRLGGWSRQLEGVAVFLGTYTPRLDDKGRLALPAKFRSELEGGLVITKGQERCLFGFPMVEFARITDQLRSAPATAPIRDTAGVARTSQDYTRVLFASASQEVPDTQGRITLPAQLREYAGLVKECAVIGHNARFEIWDAAAWDAYLNRVEEPFAQGGEAPAWL
jgi:MraZ protein